MARAQKELEFYVMEAGHDILPADPEDVSPVVKCAKLHADFSKGEEVTIDGLDVRLDMAHLVDHSCHPDIWQRYHRLRHEINRRIRILGWLVCIVLVCSMGPFIAPGADITVFLFGSSWTVLLAHILFCLLPLAGM